MRRFPKLATFVVWCFASVAIFAMRLAATAVVGKLTGSGLLGICGPNGPTSDLLGSALFSLAASVYVARRSYRYLTREKIRI